MPRFYLSDLDTSETLTVAATMSGSSATITADSTIAKSISLSKAKAIFKCIFTDGSLSTAPTGNFSADADFLTTFATVADSDVLKFMDGLVQEMTGFSGSSDVLDNEAAMKTEITTRFASGITTIETGAGSGPAACVSLFNQIKAADPGRFELTSSVPTTASGNDFSGKSYTNCLVTATGAGSGGSVNAFTYAMPLGLTVTGHNGSGGNYSLNDVLLFIHPVTGTGFSRTLTQLDADLLNGSNSGTIAMTEIAAANITATTFSLFNKLGTNADTTTVTPTGNPVLTTEVSGGNITDTTITTDNTSGSSDFSDGEIIVAYKIGASPEAIVITLNPITAAFLNNDLANAGGVSMPLVSSDELDFKLTLAAKADQKDASGDAITYSYSYALRGTLDA
jgi:hypothetical protein